MKRIITTMIIMLSTLLSFSQITVEKNETRTLESYRMGNLCLKHTPTIGEYFITITTDNRYDDLFILNLGNTKDKAKQSLESLLTIVNGDFGTYYIGKTIATHPKYDKNRIYLKGEHNAGTAAIHRNDIKGFIEILSKE